MEASIDFSRRTPASIHSVSTSTSRASEGFFSDVERGEKSGSRLGYRTPSVGDPRGPSPGIRSEPMQDRVKRKREFRGRHIQMMAIGTAIGAGVLYQSGRSLYFAGPISTLIAYILMGTVMYAVLISTGEMVSYLPLPGGFSSLANRILSPSVGFALGWIYFFSMMLNFPNKLIAASNYMAHWIPRSQVPSEVWISVWMIPPIIFNLFNVRRYGEIEFWLTLQKVFTFILLIVYGVLMTMGASAKTPLSGTDPKTNTLVPCNDPKTENCVGPIGFNYWRDPAFKEMLLGGGIGRLIGFWSVCCQACFAYSGFETIAITAEEVERPRETVPKAVRRVSSRLNIYYIGAIFVLGLNVSANDPKLKSFIDSGDSSYSGAFVLAAQRAGLPAFGDFLNAMALGAALSVSNASVYVSSRVLYALAREGQAPKIFLKKNGYDVAWVALIAACLPAALAYMSVGQVSSGDFFDFLSGMSTTGSLIAWTILCAAYLRFRKACKVQGIEVVEESKSPLQPALAWYGLLWSCFLTIFQGFLAFSRHRPYWSIVADKWGFTLGPYAAMGGFALLVLIWLTRVRLRQGHWTWQTPTLERIDLIRGIAPETVPPPKEPILWRRIGHEILEFL